VKQNATRRKGQRGWKRIVSTAVAPLRGRAQKALAMNIEKGQLKKNGQSRKKVGNGPREGAPRPIGNDCKKIWPTGGNIEVVRKSNAWAKRGNSGAALQGKIFSQETNGL